MTPFPSQMRRAVRCPEIRRVSVPLVCICRRPRFNDDNITSRRCCGQCFHVGLDNESACFVIRIVNGTQASGFVHCMCLG